MFESVNPLLLKKEVIVGYRGETVVIRVGNVDLPMHYTHAFAVSGWIRAEGAKAKAKSGRAKTLRSLAVPDSVTNNLPLPNERGNGPGIHVKEKLVTYKRSDVILEGKMVAITIGAQTLRLHYNSALKVAQHIRVWAKQARNQAGDTRHWSEINEE